jgi:aspartate-semialdehyde dehydrogenase
MKNNFKLAIVGASGVVGQKIIQLLEEMALDIGEVFFSW